MAEYQKKVDSIIEKIVDGKIEFHTKSFVEQSDTKTDMAKCINGAINSLNDLGQKLALDELENRINQDETKVFDNNGNINIVELTKIANNIVNVTIENAKKKGIDVTNKIEIPKDKVEIKTDNETTKIENMLKNYENLSSEEKQGLWDKFGDMSIEEQQRLEEANRRDWQKIAQETTDKTTKSLIKRRMSASKIVETMLHSNNSRKKEFFERLISADNRFEPWYREKIDEDGFVEIDEKVMSRYVQYIYKNEEKEKDFFRIRGTKKDTEVDLEQVIPQDFINQYTNTEGFTLSTSYEKYLARFYDYIIDTAKEFGILDTGDRDIKESVTSHKMLKDTVENAMSPSDGYDIFGFINNKKTEDINREANFMEELESAKLVIPDIQSALSQYKDFFADLEQEDIEYLCELTSEERNQQLTEIFYEIDPGNVNVLTKISDITFNGKFRKILENKDGKNFILQQLDQLIVPTKEASLTDVEFEQGLLEGTLAFEEMLFEVQERTEETIQEERIIDDADEHEGANNRGIEEQEDDTMSIETQGIEEYFSFLKTTEIVDNDLIEVAMPIRDEIENQVEIGTVDATRQTPVKPNKKENDGFEM